MSYWHGLISRVSVKHSHHKPPSIAAPSISGKCRLRFLVLREFMCEVIALGMTISPNMESPCILLFPRTWKGWPPSISCITRTGLVFKLASLTQSLFLLFAVARGGITEFTHSRDQERRKGTVLSLTLLPEASRNGLDSLAFCSVSFTLLSFRCQW